MRTAAPTGLRQVRLRQRGARPLPEARHRRGGRSSRAADEAPRRLLPARARRRRRGWPPGGRRSRACRPGTSGSRSRIRSRSLLVVLGLARREQEDLRVDPLERRGERLLVVDVGDDLEPELAARARAAPRGAPRRRAPRRRSGTRRRRRLVAASGGASTRKRIGKRGRVADAVDAGAVTASPSAPCSSAARADVGVARRAR